MKAGLSSTIMQRSSFTSDAIPSVSLTHVVLPWVLAAKPSGIQSF
jgi:hypothetical protein